MFQRFVEPVTVSDDSIEHDTYVGRDLDLPVQPYPRPMKVQIHVAAPDLKKLADGESETERQCWRVVTNDRPRMYCAVHALYVTGTVFSFTTFPEARHGEAWLIADAADVHVQVNAGDYFKLATELTFDLPFDSDEAPEVQRIADAHPALIGIGAQ